MFISRFVGLFPQPVTRVRLAPLAVAQIAAMPASAEVEKSIVMLVVRLWRSSESTIMTIIY